MLGLKIIDINKMGPFIERILTLKTLHASLLIEQFSYHRCGWHAHINVSMLFLSLPSFRPIYHPYELFNGETNDAAIAIQDPPIE